MDIEDEMMTIDWTRCEVTQACPLKRCPAVGRFLSPSRTAHEVRMYIERKAEEFGALKRQLAAVKSDNTRLRRILDERSATLRTDAPAQ